MGTMNRAELMGLFSGRRTTKQTNPDTEKASTSSCGGDGGGDRGTTGRPPSLFHLKSKRCGSTTTTTTTSSKRIAFPTKVVQRGLSLLTMRRSRSEPYRKQIGDDDKSKAREAKDEAALYDSVASVSTDEEEEDSSQAPSEQDKQEEGSEEEVICQASLSSDGSSESSVTLRRSNVNSLKPGQCRRDEAELFQRDKSQGNGWEQRVYYMPEQDRVPLETAACDKERGVFVPRNASLLDQACDSLTIQDSHFTFPEGNNAYQALPRGHGRVKDESTVGEATHVTSVFVSYDNKSTFDGTSWHTSSDTVIALPSIQEQNEGETMSLHAAKTACSPHYRTKDQESKGTSAGSVQKGEEDSSVEGHSSDHISSESSAGSQPKSSMSTNKSACTSIQSLDNHVQAWERKYVEKDPHLTWTLNTDSFWEDSSIKSDSEKVRTDALTVKQTSAVPAVATFNRVEANALSAACFLDKLCG